MTLPAAAIGLGVSALEKHLTLGGCMELEDYESAMNPDQFKVFVESVKDIASALGIGVADNDFGMSEAEKQYRKNIRRHVVVSRDITSDEVIEAADVVLKRTSANKPYTDILSVYGKKLDRDLKKNSPILMEDIS